MQPRDRVAIRYRLFVAMSLLDAKAILGIPADATPTDDEIRKAQRIKVRDLGHDRGGSEEEIVKVNRAADILLGKQPPSYGGSRDSTPYETTTYEAPKRPDPIVVTFEEAKRDAHIPTGVNWLFVTEKAYSGYNTDEFTRSATGYVIVGETEDHWVAVSVERYERQDHFMSSEPSENVFSMGVTKSTRIVEPQAVYGLIVKAWKLMSNVEKEFNSKIRLVPTGFDFDDLKRKYPHETRSTTVKNFLVDSGRVDEGGLKTPRKFNIELKYVQQSIVEKGNYRFYEGPLTGWKDMEALIAIVNGTEYQFSESDLRKLGRLKVGGKKFINQIFGQYVYPGTIKNLTRNGKGKEIMAWMVQNLTDVPEPLMNALRASSAGQKSV